MIEDPEYSRKLIKEGYWITMEQYDKLKVGDLLTHKRNNWDTGEKEDCTVLIGSLYKDDDGNGRYSGNIVDENGKHVAGVGGLLAPYIAEDDIREKLKKQLNVSPEEKAAYQCAYDLSNDWQKKSPGWEDVTKAFLMGIEYQKNANK